MLSRVIVVVKGGMPIRSRNTGITVAMETLVTLTVTLWHVERAVAASLSQPVGK
jgi:hypothetical protein